jgi:uncharacterized membrane protein YciS (DUF1049 family)
VNRLTFWLGLLVVALGGTVLTLGWLQNSSRTTDLSLNLGFAAWRLAEPVAVPALLATASGVGFVLGMFVFGAGWLRASRRARRAERQVALSGSGWSAPPVGGQAPDAPLSARADDDGWK